MHSENIEPREIIAGDSARWKKSVSSYPASEGWTLAYALVGPGGVIGLSSQAEGDDYSVFISPNTSALYIPGEYTWQAYVSKPGERKTIDAGKLTVKPNFAAITDGADMRAHVKKVLDNIEAVIEGRATMDQMEYQISGRMLKRTPIPDLILLRTKYKAEYQRALNSERMAQGLGTKNRIRVRF